VPLAVVGYDDVPMASHPALGLTTVHQPGEAMGARAVQMLLERFAGRTEPAREIFDVELKVRTSAGVPPT
jgi:LacI family transcriptional regulator